MRRFLLLGPPVRTAFLLVAYVVSSGPAWYIAGDPQSGEVAEWWHDAYRPLNDLADKLGPVGDVYWWYVQQACGRCFGDYWLSGQTPNDSGK